MIYTPNIQFYVVKQNKKNMGTPPSSLVFVCGVTHFQSNPIEISTISRWFFSVDHRPLIPRVSRSEISSDLPSDGTRLKVTGHIPFAYIIFVHSSMGSVGTFSFMFSTENMVPMVPLNPAESS
jgi:hypothetical protein